MDNQKSPLTQQMIYFINKSQCLENNSKNTEPAKKGGFFRP